MAVGDAAALRRWNSIVKETQPIFDDIESGNFSNQDLSRLSQVLRKQSKLASTIFEQNVKLLTTQAQSYVPQIKDELAKIGQEVSPKNISKVVDAVFKNLLADNIQQITEKVKDVVTTDSSKQFEKAAKDAYADFLRQYGRPSAAAPKGGDYVRLVDPDSNKSVLEKIYNSVVNLAQAIVDLPSTVADKVKSGIESGVTSLVDAQQGALSLQDFGLKQEVVPLPEKLEEKLTKEPPQEILPKVEETPVVSSSVSSEIESISKPVEEPSTSNQDMLDGFNKIKSDFIQSVVRDGNETRERMGAQTGVIVSAIENSVNDVALKPAQKKEEEAKKDDDKEKEKKEKSLVMRIVDRLGYKYVRAIKSGVDAFSDKLHKAFDKIKDFAGTTMKIGKYLMLGGVGLYIASRLIEKIKWTELIKSALSKIFPGLFKKVNEDPTAPENDPRNTNDDGTRSGFGVNEKGEKQYTVQTPDGKFTTVVTKADGSREIRESDYDTRVVQDGPYKGWMVKETGNLSELEDSPFGEEDTGTYTDYINPQTGKVVRHYDSMYGIETKDRTLVEKDEEAAKQISQGGVVVSTVPAQQPAPTMKLPADYDAPSKTLTGQASGTDSYASPMGAPTNSKVVAVRPATSYFPKEKESKSYSAPMQPAVSTSKTKGKQAQAPMALMDMLNLTTTRTNGNRADETLGLLNGRDF